MYSRERRELASCTGYLKVRKSGTSGVFGWAMAGLAECRLPALLEQLIHVVEEVCTSLRLLTAALVLAS